MKLTLSREAVAVCGPLLFLNNCFACGARREQRHVLLGTGDFGGDEQRSAVDAQRRPPPHEPGPGSACRDALKPRMDY